MKTIRRTAIHAAVVSAIAGLALFAGPALADESTDLKAEIAAQRAML